MEKTISHHKSQRLNNIVATLRLGAIIVNFRFDHYFDHDDIKHRLQRSIQRLPPFLPNLQNQLDDYLQQKIQQPENIAVAKTEIAALSVQQKYQVSRILVKIIFAEGDIPLCNVNKENIEHLYLALGLDNAFLSKDLDLLFPKSSADTDFFLDMTAVESHQLQTQYAQSVLNDVFDNKEKDQSLENIAHIADRANNDELDSKHKRLYQYLSSKSLWSNEELKIISAECKLPMIHGMIEKINRWACETVDYSVFIKDKNGISVDAEIVQEINNK